jgi:hypothetical protein
MGYDIWTRDRWPGSLAVPNLPRSPVLSWLFDLPVVARQPMAVQASNLDLPAWCARMPTTIPGIRFANARRRHAVKRGVGSARLDQPRIRHVLLAVDHARAEPELRFGAAIQSRALWMSQSLGTVVARQTAAYT